MHYNALIKGASCALLIAIGQSLPVSAQSPTPPQPIPAPAPATPSVAPTPAPPAIEAPPATPSKVIDDVAAPGGDAAPEAPKRVKTVTKRAKRGPTAAAVEEGDNDNENVGDGRPRVVRKVVRFKTENGETTVDTDDANEIKLEALDRAKEAVDRAKGQLAMQKGIIRRGGDARGVFAMGPSRRTMVLPMTAADPTTFSQTHEDLSTMHRLLAKATHTKGDVFRFAGGDREFDAMYLESFGAVFLLNVDYPLAEAPKVEKKPAEGAKDPDWEAEKEQAKNEGGQTFFRRDGGGEGGGGEEIEFNAERVNRLKTRMIDSLKHAVNIRALKPNEDVVVVVAGRNQGGIAFNGFPGVGGVAFAGGGGFGGQVNQDILVAPAVAPGGKIPPVAPLTWSMINSDHGLQSAMVLRVKKSLIDDLNAGKITADDFRSKVDVHTY